MASVHHAIVRHVSRATRSKHTKRALYVGGAAALTAGAIAAILFYEKKANAAPMPQGPTGGPLSPVQQAAMTMADVLATRGYKIVDQGVYVAFQQAAGLSPTDGFPGTNTMNALKSTLQSISPTPSVLAQINALPVYPWRSTCASGSGDACYDGTNAPALSDWLAGSGQSTTGGGGNSGGVPANYQGP